MKRENFYRRDPGKALSGMVGLSLEERGVYNTILDLLYSTWRPLEDNRPFIANWCGCAVQKLNPILRRLIERGRIVTFEEGGRIYISDEAFEVERTAVKGAAGTASGRGKVGEKSGEVEEKSTGVDDNPTLLDVESPTKQQFIPLERQEREEKRDIVVEPSAQPTSPARRRSYPVEFEVAWAAYPHTPGRSSKPDALAEWKRLPEDERGGLVAAITRFSPCVADVCGGKGAPCMARWIKHGKHLNWAEQGVTQTMLLLPTSPPPDPWPSRVREYRRNAFWNRVDWGPPPGKPGCKLSPELLISQGIVPTPTVNAA